jgi:hypothetical protein
MRFSLAFDLRLNEWCKDVPRTNRVAGNPLLGSLQCGNLCQSNEERNFTRAADKCNVSQPSLSRAIQLLEAELGGISFRRERNRSHLSELGEMVRPHLELFTTARFQPSVCRAI